MKHGFVKVAAAVPFVKVADCAYNAARIERMIIQAEEQGVEIMVTPELSITGYTCGDLFYQSLLIEQAYDALIQLVERTAHTKVLTIVGMPVRVEEKLFNSAIVFQQGKILGAIPKTYLPNYREFQEKRWFSASNTLQYETVTIGAHEMPIGHNIIFDSEGVGIGIEICEDMWTPYTPGTRLALYGAHIICNLSASNENVGKHNYLRSLIESVTARSLGGYVYASCGYGESSTDLVYTGKAFVAELGTIMEEMPRFEYKERMIVSDIDVSLIQSERRINSSFQSAVNHFTQDALVTIPFTLRSHEESAPMNRHVDANPFMPARSNVAERAAEMFEIQVCGLMQRLQHMRASHAVIGLSGGLDSTLALLVTCMAFERLGLPTEQILGITMPGFGTSTRTLDNAHRQAQLLGVSIQEIDIRPACLLHMKDIGHPQDQVDTTYENVQARERTQVLMDMANRFNAPVIGTGDLSELALGWCTYNGDQMSMYGVNSGITKTLVQEIVRWYATQESVDAALSAVLQNVLSTPISPELRPMQEGVQLTEKSVGAYALHDFFLYHFLYSAFTPEKIFFLARVAFGDQYTALQIKDTMRIFFSRFFSQQYKRSASPDGPKVLSVSLSPRGTWRMPSDASAALWLKAVEELPTAL